MRSYELMYILDPTLDEDGQKALIGKVEEFMTNQGVQVQDTEPWGKRRLAYRIKGHWDGSYVLSHLTAPPDAISEMERRLRVTEGILRFLTVRIDEQQAKLERRKARKEEYDRARRGRRQAKAAEAAAASKSAETPVTPAPAAAPESGAAPAGNDNATEGEG